MVMKSYNERCEGDEEALSTVVASALMKISAMVRKVSSLLRINTPQSYSLPGFYM